MGWIEHHLRVDLDILLVLVDLACRVLLGVRILVLLALPWHHILLVLLGLVVLEVRRIRIQHLPSLPVVLGVQHILCLPLLLQFRILYLPLVLGDRYILLYLALPLLLVHPVNQTKLIVR